MLVPLRDIAGGNHGRCIDQLGLDICFAEYSYRESLQACLIKEISHCVQENQRHKATRRVTRRRSTMRMRTQRRQESTNVI